VNRTTKGKEKEGVNHTK